MSSDEKIASRTGGVEVVADQGDDGSFEIRLERQGDSGPVTAPISVAETGAWRAEAATHAEASPVTSKTMLWGGAGLGAVALLGGLFMISNAPRELNGNRPKTVSVSSEPQFRGYMVEGRSPARASNLRLEFDGDGDTQNAANPFDYDQDDDLDGPDATGVQLAPSTGFAAAPSARGGGALVPGESGDGVEVDPFEGLTRVERNRLGAQMLKDAVEEQVEINRRNRAQREPELAPSRDVEVQNADELGEEYGFDEAYDEDYDLYE